MTDYTKLVQSLRCKRDDCEGCGLAFFDKDEGWMCQYAAKDDDAADAIEELQAENPIVESVLVDKMRQQMEETVCHCNVKENAELIARILDDDVDGKAFEMPKRGEWKCSYPEIEPNPMFMYGICSICGFEQSISNKLNYCPNCGAKMEVQDG